MADKNAYADAIRGVRYHQLVPDEYPMNRGMRHQKDCRKFS
ncbi:hypothetical protein C900_00189 [Fulvivirga imtechensis AK7]|uniref:Uncharacterized protein n=1 Tax=Fulvivirga imtechensis AK7 TaxID=1237149 RepID=L8JIJ0_9BACT|nr:hypothetical protein C900_00189 [Fulvivirga imtechensis AK7]